MLAAIVFHLSRTLRLLKRLQIASFHPSKDTIVRDPKAEVNVVPPFVYGSRLSWRRLVAVPSEI